MLGYKKISVVNGKDKIIINFKNGFRVEINKESSNVIGIGRVSFKGKDLRNNNYSIIPFIKSIDGVRYDKFELTGIRQKNGRVYILANALGRMDAEVEWMDFFNHEFVTMPVKNSFTIKEKFCWEFGEYAENVVGRVIPGFYYSYTLNSEHDFHCMIERGTWEIDRLKKPVIVIAQRAGNLPWESIVSKEKEFVTHEVIDFGGNLPNISGRERVGTNEGISIWQMMPRAAGSQIFDFQATKDGCIAVYNPVPAYIQACQRKEKGSEIIAHLERVYFSRRKGIKTGKKVVLAYFPEEKLSIESIRDMWSDILDTVNDKWRKFYNYPEDKPDTAFSPTCWPGMLDKYPLKNKEIKKMFPKMAEYRVKRLFAGAYWISDYTEGFAKDLCAPWQWNISPKLGGNEFLKDLCDEAHKYGIEVFIWVCAHISRLSPLIKKHPEWITYDRNNNPLVAHVHPSIYILDYNSGYRDYFKQQMLKIKKECGIDGIFIDSYHNLNFQPINYADTKMPTNMDSLIKFQKDMRAAGLKIMIETQGIFGTSLNWLNRGFVKLDSMKGLEHTFYKNMFCVNTEWLEDGSVDEEYCYRATANNCPVRVETDFSDHTMDFIFPEKVFDKVSLGRINNDYQAVKNRMVRRRTLTSDRGVEWMDEYRKKVRVLFAFKNFKYEASPGVKIFDVTEGKKIDVSEKYVNVKKFHTYKIGE